MVNSHKRRSLNKFSIIILGLTFLIGCGTNQMPLDTAGKLATAVDYTDRPAFFEVQLPQEEHNVYEKLKGNWILRGSGYLPSANGPVPTDGEATGNWVVDKNFFEWKETSSLENDTKQHSEKRIYMGYDNLREMYTMWIMSSESVMTQYLTGYYDQKKSELTFRRTSIISFEGEQVPFHVRMVINVDMGVF